MVPHTPVLEAKQLQMVSQSQTIPCTPSDPPTSAVPQLAISAISMQATGGEQDDNFMHHGWITVITLFVSKPKSLKQKYSLIPKSL